LKWSKRNSAGPPVERVNEEKGPTKSEAFKSFQQDKTRGHFRSDILTVDCDNCATFAHSKNGQSHCDLGMETPACREAGQHHSARSLAPTARPFITSCRARLGLRPDFTT
jgi:hypothetical protein